MQVATSIKLLLQFNANKCNQNNDDSYGIADLHSWLYINQWLAIHSRLEDTPHTQTQGQ
jgi:hypothetical protein